MVAKRTSWDETSWAGMKRGKGPRCHVEVHSTLRASSGKRIKLAVPVKLSDSESPCLQKRYKPVPYHAYLFLRSSVPPSTNHAKFSLPLVRLNSPATKKEAVCNAATKFENGLSRLSSTKS
eukprot:966428-Rhodomonas_salina.1